MIALFPFPLQSFSCPFLPAPPILPLSKGTIVISCLIIHQSISQALTKGLCVDWSFERWDKKLRQLKSVPSRANVLVGEMVKADTSASMSLSGPVIISLFNAERQFL